MFLKISEGGLGNGKCPETLRGQKNKKKTGTKSRSNSETVGDNRNDRWRCLGNIEKNEEEEGEE